MLRHNHGANRKRARIRKIRAKREGALTEENARIRGLVRDALIEYGLATPATSSSKVPTPTTAPAPALRQLMQAPTGAVIRPYHNGKPT